MVTISDGAELWTAVEGAGPPVVLVHGGPGLWDHLGDLAALLADDFTVHRWDQRGCGRSTEGNVPASLRRTLDDLDELRAHFGHESWAVVGHSWGAHVALLHGLLLPARTTAVAYLSGIGTPRWWRDVGRPTYRANREARMTAADLDRLAALGAAPARTAEEEATFRRLSWATDFVAPGDALERMVATDLPIRFDLNRRLAHQELLDDSTMRDRCERSEVPVLLLHGADDPRPVGGAEQLAGWLGTAVEVVPDAGHLPWVEQPDAVASSLRSFLRDATRRRA